jgi:hypothetical protein
MSEYIENGIAIVRPFPGATSDDMQTYVLPTIKKEVPDKVIIHVGCGVVGLMEECWEKEGMLHGCLDGMSELGVFGAVVFCTSHSTLSLLNSLVFTCTASCKLFNFPWSNSFW